MKLAIQKTMTAAVFVVAILSTAQAVVIGTADLQNSIPSGITGGNFVYQQVYNSSNFSSAIDINSITFYDTFGSTGGTPRSGNFDVFLSTTSAAVGSALGFPGFASLTEMYNTPLPTLANGRLDFSNLPVFHYDPSQGNLLLTILAFGTTQGTLSLDFMGNAGSIMSRNIRKDKANPTEVS